MFSNFLFGNCCCKSNNWNKSSRNNGCCNNGWFNNCCNNGGSNNCGWLGNCCQNNSFGNNNWSSGFCNCEQQLGGQGFNNCFGNWPQPYFYNGQSLQFGNCPITVLTPTELSIFPQ